MWRACYHVVFLIALRWSMKFFTIIILHEAIAIVWLLFEQQSFGENKHVSNEHNVM